MFSYGGIKTQDVDVVAARNIGRQCQTDNSMLPVEWACRNNKHRTHYRLKYFIFAVR